MSPIPLHQPQPNKSLDRLKNVGAVKLVCRDIWIIFKTSHWILLGSKNYCLMLLTKAFSMTIYSAPLSSMFRSCLDVQEHDCTKPNLLGLAHNLISYQLYMELSCSDMVPTANNSRREMIVLFLGHPVDHYMNCMGLRIQPLWFFLCFGCGDRDSEQ